MPRIIYLDSYDSVTLPLRANVGQFRHPKSCMSLYLYSFLRSLSHQSLLGLSRFIEDEPSELCGVRIPAPMHRNELTGRFASKRLRRSLWWLPQLINLLRARDGGRNSRKTRREVTIIIYDIISVKHHRGAATTVQRPQAQEFRDRAR